MGSLLISFPKKHACGKFFGLPHLNHYKEQVFVDTLY